MEKTALSRPSRPPGPPASFPGAEAYRALTSPGRPCVRETREPAPDFPYTERHVQCVWYDSSLRPASLFTAAGEPVAVEDPGRWNLESGPDFLDAVLRIGPERRRVTGDVEVHVWPRDWLTHDHAADTAYSRLIAHVTFFPAALPPASLPPGALQIPLRDPLRANPAFSFDCVDLTAYPYRLLPAQPPPCAAILARRTADDWIALLESAGQERMRIKAARMAASIVERDRDQVLYEELMAAFGYKHNAAPFRRLAIRLPLASLRRESEGDAVKAYALLLGIAGLLPAKASAGWDDDTRALVRRLWDHWWKMKSQWEFACFPAGQWRVSGIRPQNHPHRRLAAAAVLFCDAESPSARLLALPSEPPTSWTKNVQAWLNPSRGIPYWNRRLALGGKRPEAHVALVGADRIGAIQTNVLVPFLAACGARPEPLLAALPPEHDNSLIRRTAYSLFGRDHNPALFRQGLRQQGLLQIFHDFCLNSRSQCLDCGLVRALAEEGRAGGVLE